MYTDLSICKTLSCRGAVLYNGGVRRLQRHGLKANGVYGKVDNLHIKYDGNRISTVLEDAVAVTQNGSMDYPGGNKELYFTYNDWGALTSDESRGITDIIYDNFGNPTQINFSNTRKIINVYSAAGEKLRTTVTFGQILHLDGVSTLELDVAPMGVDAVDATPSIGTIPQNVTEYHGPVIYRNSKLDMVLFPGGYATQSGSDVTFHYYTQDYLGNNRAVINGSTGAIEQTIAYYPYGGVIADLGTPTTGQPYKFGGKELITVNGLNEYDFGARNYYSAVPGFTKPDPLCEKYPWISPYLYCLNNPVNAFDPDGNIVIFVNGMHFGDGGRPKYWNNVDCAIQNALNDYSAKYIDGSFGGMVNWLSTGIPNTNLIAKNRHKQGFNIGEKIANSIYSNLSEEETIKIISHSMGAAATKGLIEAFLEYANEKGIDPKIEFELDLAPFQPNEQVANKEVPTYTVSHEYDKLAGLSNMKNAKNFHTRKDKKDSSTKTEHSIDSFKDEVVRLINEGKIKTSVIYK